MAKYTYSGDPSSTNRDAVRFLIRDTGPTWQISDEEVAYLLAQFPNTFLAAAAGAEVIATNFSNQVRTKTVGSLSLTYEVQATNYRDLASLLRDQAKKGATLAIAPYAGGISHSDKQLAELDTDRVDPFFYRRMNDHPGTSEIYRLHRTIDEAYY